MSILSAYILRCSLLLFLQAVPGFRAILSHGKNGFHMSMDMTATAFVSSQRLLQYMAILLGLPGGEGAFSSPLPRVSQRTRRETVSKIKGLEVEMEDVGRTGKKRKFVIAGISDKNANEYMFPWPGNPNGPGPVSIAYYFKEKYNLTLRFPLVPVIEIKPGRNTFVPAELLK